jgi:hypothetical protein
MSLVNFIDRNLKLIKKLLVIILPLLVVLVLLYIKFFYEVNGGIQCVTYKYFGIYCTGCGTTRSLYYLLLGDIKTAFYYNVGIVIIYPAYVYLYYLLLRWSITDKKFEIRHAYTLAVFAGIMIIYMILRNIPIKIFDILRPLT